jgi:hypothetical protein
MIQRSVRNISLAGLISLAGFLIPVSLPAQTAASADTPPPPPAPVTTAAPVPSQPVPASQVPSLPAYQHTSPTPVDSLPKPVKSTSFFSLNAYSAPAEYQPREHFGSVYIPLDSWVYPAMLRLYSLGYLDSLFIGMRPYTRLSALHAIQLSQDDIVSDDDPQAVAILNDLLRELQTEVHPPQTALGAIAGVDSVYTRLLGISGLPLRDSYHIGQTLVNDYGRPYQQGFNNITGFSALGESGRFSLYVRGEYQHSPSAPGYSSTLAAQLASIDTVTGPMPATIPLGPLLAQNPFRLVEANLSAHLVGHEISFGKSDAWLGPAFGGAMSWSNNAENIYSFRINRVEPLHIPLLSRLIGPMRYDFFVGSLKGHTTPNAPWVHAEKFSFRPSENFEFGFQRTVIWGGAGHEPITLHTFLKSFFDINDTTSAEKFSRNDPGARFTAFDMSYRLPFMRRWLTFYTDSEAHDDVTPPSAPRRAAYRPGLYLSHIPRLPQMDLRVEAVSTDPNVSRSVGGSFNYFETVQRDGYTNKGFILGDWIGREAKGGQAWLTWHLSGSQWIQLEYLNKKTPTNFIPGGTTQNQFKAETFLRLRKSIDLDAWVQYEGWKAPIYKQGLQSNVATAVQITWHPGLHTTH